jgi:acetylornithine deacetylase/succinyl-diaminopimelate desuccinylase-like protein
MPIPSHTQADVVELAARLMEIDSTSGREGAVVDWLESYLTGADWVVRRIAVTPGRDDLLATSGADPAITFSTHLDTAPPACRSRSCSSSVRK